MHWKLSIRPQNTSNGFFDSRKFLIYDKWKRLYDLFTNLLNNVMDLTEKKFLMINYLSLKDLETNANFYLSAYKS